MDVQVLNKFEDFLLFVLKQQMISLIGLFFINGNITSTVSEKDLLIRFLRLFVLPSRQNRAYIKFQGIKLGNVRIMIHAIKSFRKVRNAIIQNLWGFLYRNNQCKLCLVIFARGDAHVFLKLVRIPANDCVVAIRSFTGHPHPKNNSIGSTDSKHLAIPQHFKGVLSKKFPKNLVNFPGKHQQLCLH